MEKTNLRRRSMAAKRQTLTFNEMKERPPTEVAFDLMSDSRMAQSKWLKRS
jgi:hypothetical protein